MSWEPHEPDSRYRIPIKRCEVTIGFTDGTTLTEPFNMILQDGEERVIEWVAVDGRKFYMPRKHEEKDLSWMGD